MQSKEEILAFMAVRAALPGMVESAKKAPTERREDVITGIRTMLVKLHTDLNAAILDLDTNVIDAFLADVKSGVFGTDFKTTLTRIHKPRGPKTEEKLSPEREAQLMAEKLFGAPKEEVEEESEWSFLDEKEGEAV